MIREGMVTPWGGAQTVTMLLPGFAFVSTAGHGGFVATLWFAEANLSEAARRYATADWPAPSADQHLFWWEEDCDYAIPCWELEAQWPTLFAHAREPEEGWKTSLLRTLSQYRGAYLEAIGQPPDPEGHRRRLAWEEHDRRKKEKDPDLITAAWGDWATGAPGVDMVATASGEYHYITAASYKAAWDFPLNLLSRCEKVDPANVPHDRPGPLEDSQRPRPWTPLA